MLFHIATVVALLSACNGEHHTHLQKMPSNYAISSQSYHREDVPLSYKYNSVHIYTTPNPAITAHEPHINKYNKQTDNVKYPNIQYAPLINPSALYSKQYIPKSHHQSNQNVYNTETTSKRDHLEPHLETNKPEALPPYSFAHLDYLPGHNIEVMQSVNRIPGHNAVYRSYPEQTVTNDKQNKVNYLRQYILYQTPQKQHVTVEQTAKDPDTTTTPVTTTYTAKTTEKTILEPIQHYRIQPQLYNGAGLAKQIANTDKQSAYKSPYTKMHALFLNVARTYNFLPHKAPLHPGANPTILGKLPSHIQALIRVPGSSKLEAPQSEKKTLVFPIQKNRHFAIHS